MGEPNKDRAVEPARLEQVERDSERDQFTATRDQNAYRAMVINRLDSLLEKVEDLIAIEKASAKATAILAKTIQDAMEEPDPAQADTEEAPPAAVAS